MRKAVAAGGILILLFIVFGGTVAAGTDFSDKKTDVKIKKMDDGKRYFAHPDRPTIHVPVYTGQRV